MLHCFILLYVWEHLLSCFAKLLCKYTLMSHQTTVWSKSKITKLRVVVFYWIILNARSTKLCEVYECHSFLAHQLDVSVSNNGAELTQVPHHPIENLSDAFPLVAAHFLDTGQLHLQSHEVCLRAHSTREEKGGEEKRWKREKIQAEGMQ